MLIAVYLRRLQQKISKILTKNAATSGTNLNSIQHATRNHAQQVAHTKHAEWWCDIDMYLTRKPVDSEKLYNLIHGIKDLINNAIIPMNQRGLYHLDLKPANIGSTAPTKCESSTGGSRPSSKTHQNP